MLKNIQISEVTKKHLKVIAYLLGSWAVSLALVEIANDPKLIGLAPVLNFIAVLIEKELKAEGYFRKK